MSETKDYFAKKADRYDLVDAQPYWQLSDALLRGYLDAQVLGRIEPGFAFLDAGGGTGRWTDFLARADPSSRGVLVDLTPEMLAEAEAKAVRNGYAERVSFHLGDLDGLELPSPPPPSTSFDLAICFHNVIGFVSDPAAVVDRIAAALAPGGLFALMAPNLLHAAYFNLTLGRVDEAERCLAGRGRFTDDMPGIHMFTAESAAALLEGAGLEVVDTVGFPVLVYPGIEDTRIEGSSAQAATMLDGPPGFQRVLELERQAMRRAGAANRGSNVVVVGRRGGL